MNKVFLVLFVFLYVEINKNLQLIKVLSKSEITKILNIQEKFKTESI